jgi:hypothetical protein
MGVDARRRVNYAGSTHPLLPYYLQFVLGQYCSPQGHQDGKGQQRINMKFPLDRMLPKERSVQLELPRLDYAHDSVDAMAKIIEAVNFRHGKQQILRNSFLRLGVPSISRMLNVKLIC